MLKILTGVVSGIISGMGMGGGAILITILVCFMNIDQKVAQASNLIFFIPTSVITTIINIKNKKIKWKLAIFVSIFGVAGALIGSYIATKINVNILRKMFAVFIIIIAIFELYYWYNKYGKRNNK